MVTVLVHSMVAGAFGISNVDKLRRRKFLRDRRDRKCVVEEVWSAETSKLRQEVKESSRRQPYRLGTTSWTLQHRTERLFLTG